jgi:calcineurin-like phosphoesterase family protein
MSETWFTSDHHFGHTNILKYEKEARPFETVEEMNEALIDRWNAVVRDNDMVFHLGDFAFGKHHISLAGRLKGRKKLVLGNHDTYANRCYLHYFEKLYGMTYWKNCLLSHMPVHPNGLGKRWLLNVHGHLHSKNMMAPFYDMAEVIGAIQDQNYFNVSVEQNNLTPINADVIMERVKILKE